MFSLKNKRVTQLEEEVALLRAQNWVLKDAQLRSYDGLADKAAKYDILLEVVTAQLVPLKLFDNYSLIKRATTIIQETLNELEPARKN